MPLFQNPPSVAPPDGQFSQLARVAAGSDLLFLSGQVPRDAHGDTVGDGDMTRQATQVFENLAALLATHGCGFADVAKATLFVTDTARIPELMAVRSRFYGSAAPASTLAVVAALGDPRWLLEVELIAVVPAR
jgi:enamine deaminase RidA (YjgF/YER057c/UK114 family)